MPTAEVELTSSRCTCRIAIETGTDVAIESVRIIPVKAIFAASSVRDA